MTKVNWMDGGILFELNKINDDFGEKLVEYNKEIIYKLYEEYINIGAKFITTNNYGFKPSRSNNWKELTYNTKDIFKKIKIKYPNVSILGCIPPFHSSYYDGEITENFLDFYRELIPILNEYVDMFIIETNISYNHCYHICDVISNLNINKSIIISIYPDNITKSQLSQLIKIHNIISIMINCCSFDKMNKYYNKEIKYLLENYNNINFGFYLNKINEQSYKYDQNKKELQNYKHNICDLEKIKKFIQNYNKKEIYIGGCCGYGINEMKELINYME
tara:strand:- start:143 stop:970 length:828 start_codon:yes stop_codon:yes gene_type:complete